jgi:hypothetical protein
MIQNYQLLRYTLSLYTNDDILSIIVTIYRHLTYLNLMDSIYQHYMLTCNEYAYSSRLMNKCDFYCFNMRKYKNRSYCCDMCSSIDEKETHLIHIHLFEDRYMDVCHTLMSCLKCLSIYYGLDNIPGIITTINPYHSSYLI